jgi:putative ABC transport system ATP-binding protein
MIRAVNIEKRILDGITETSILTNVNFSIDKGEYVCLYGPMGSGKSTIIKILGLLMSPSSGELFLFDKVVSGFSDQQQLDFRKGLIGYLFRDSLLIDNITVAENIAMPLMYLKNRKSDINRKVNHQLNLFGLSHKSGDYPTSLTQYQKQLVSLARALVIEPQLLLVDEPSARLSSTQGNDFIDLLNQVHKDDLTIVLATQSSLISCCANRVLNVFDGHVGSEQSTIAR